MSRAAAGQGRRQCEKSRPLRGQKAWPITFRDQPQDKQAAKEALWAVLQRKGRLQEIGALEHRFAKQQPELFRRWLLAGRTTEECDRASISPRAFPESQGGTRCRVISSDGSEQRRPLDRALLNLYEAAPGSERDLGVVEFPEVLGSLQEGGWVLVEIAQFRVFQPEHPLRDPWGESRYAAYVLFADGRIEFKDLGESNRINAVVAKVRRLEADPQSNIAAARGAAQLYECTLGQFELELAGHSKLYVASDGDLGLVDFGSMIDRKGRWFVEQHLVVNLTSGRDLVRLRRGETQQNGAQIDYLVANPSFLYRDQRTVRSTSDRNTSAGQTLGSSAIACGAVFGKGESWPRVGITRQYVDGFRAALPGLKIYERDQATEGVVKQIERPRTLWFITHGFFCENATAGLGIDPSGGVPGTITKGKWDDPMLRGALVLAGAQVGGTGDGEDGYLQSAEIVDRNWEGTELVVLGACETALGVPSIGDGVYGMRRAFTVAGVRSQVMTLWQVNQAQTFELLQAFAKLLRQGQSRGSARGSTADAREVPAPVLLGRILFFRRSGTARHAMKSDVERFVPT